MIKQFILKNSKYLMFLGIFIFYFAIALHNLTHSSLWYDETIEYFFSKYFFGEIPININEEMPYQRLLSALQPPLYNFIMYFWLKIHDSELWFRLFGVFAGGVAIFGIYKSLLRLIDYKWAGAFCCFTVCLYNFIYYCQECAEYNLMLCFVAWFLYFFVKLLEKITIKDTVLFVVLGSLSVGVQYGSAFCIVGAGIVLFIKALLEKDFKALKLLSFSYFSAFIFFALPLYWFFAKIQLTRPDMAAKVLNIHFIRNNFIFDFLSSFFHSVHYIFSCHNFHLKLNLPINFVISQFLVVFIFISGLLFGLIKSLKEKEQNRIFCLNITFIIVWLFYYIAVKFGFYAYGKFSNRYELFLYPLTVIVFGTDIVFFVQNLLKTKLHNILKGGFIWVLVCILCYFCSYNLKFICQNWEKEDYRGLVNFWYKNKLYENQSVIYYELRHGFGYYFLNDKRYKKEYENSFVMQPWSGDTDDYQTFFKEHYGENLPDSFYFCFGHNVNKDIYPIIISFISMGYIFEEVYEGKNVAIVLFKKI